LKPANNQHSPKENILRTKPFYRSKTLGFVTIAVILALQSPVKEILEGKRRSIADYWDVLCIALIAGGTAYSRSIAQGPLAIKPKEEPENDSHSQADA
jgi:hypothetical protein